MKFEFVEFYPIPIVDKKQKLIGTVHVYLVEKKMDIRGIKVFKLKGKNFRIQLPYMRGWDSEEKKEVQFPVVSFSDEVENQEFWTFIREEVYQKVRGSLIFEEWVESVAQKLMEKTQKESHAEGEK